MLLPPAQVAVPDDTSASAPAVLPASVRSTAFWVCTVCAATDAVMVATPAPVDTPKLTLLLLLNVMPLTAFDVPPGALTLSAKLPHTLPLVLLKLTLLLFV